MADASGQSLTFITATSETEVETSATVTDGNNEVTTVRGQWTGTAFSCDDGFELLGGICRDINECDSITCEAGFSCYNFDGGYECRDDSASECLDGFENFPECTDINECDSSPCSPNASCTNTRGSYLCSCNDGYYEADGECKVCVQLKNVLIKLKAFCISRSQSLSNFRYSFEILKHFLRMSMSVSPLLIPVFTLPARITLVDMNVHASLTT